MNNKKKKVYGKQAKRKKNAASPASPSLKYADGGFAWEGENTGSAIGALGGMAGGILSDIGQPDSLDQKPNSAATIGGGALSGAAAGAAFGPIGMGVGAVIGGIGGVLSAGKQRKAYDYHQKQLGDRNLERLENMTGTNTAGAYGATSRFPYMQDGGNIPYFANGGFTDDGDDDFLSLFAPKATGPKFQGGLKIPAGIAKPTSTPYGALEQMAARTVKPVETKPYSPREQKEHDLAATAFRDATQHKLDYINSPKYKERLSKFYKNPNEIVKQRLNAVNTVSYDPYVSNSSTGIDHGGASYESTDNKVLYNLYPDTEGHRATTMAHEISHVTNATYPHKGNQSLPMTRGEESFIFNRNKNIGEYTRNSITKQLKDIPANKKAPISSLMNPFDSHDTMPTENKSDIDAFRYMLNRSKIYDAGTQDFNQEFLNKARKNKNISNDFFFKRLQENFSDKDLIDIMNTVAMNQQPDSQEIQMAKNGGYVIPKGYHRMPDGNLMNDDEMYRHGGYFTYTNSNQDYAADSNSVVGDGYSGPTYANGGFTDPPVNVDLNFGVGKGQVVPKHLSKYVKDNYYTHVNTYLNSEGHVVNPNDLPDYKDLKPLMVPVSDYQRAINKGMSLNQRAYQSGVMGLPTGTRVRGTQYDNKGKQGLDFNRFESLSPNYLNEQYQGLQDIENKVSYADGGNVQNPILENDFLPTINIEQGELLVDFNKRGGSGEIVSKYYNDGEKFNGVNPMTGEKYQPHASGKKAEPQSNFTLVPEDGQFVISKKYAKNYDRAYNENDKITMGTIKLNIENDNMKKGDMQKAGKMKLGGMIPKYDDGGYGVKPKYNFNIDPELLINTEVGYDSPKYNNTLPETYDDSFGYKGQLTGDQIKAGYATERAARNNAWLNKAATLAPSLYNIGRGLFGSEQEQEFVQPSSVYTKGVLENMPQDINFNPIVDRLMSERDAAIRRIEDSTSSPSVARANIQNLYSNTNKAISEAMMQGQLAQNQIRGQRAGIYGGLAGQDIQSQMATEQANLGIRQMNAQNRAAAQDIVGAGLTGISDYTQMQQLNKNQQKADAIRLGAMRDVFTRYKLDPEIQKAIINSDATPEQVEALIKNGLFQFNKGN